MDGWMYIYRYTYRHVIQIHTYMSYIHIYLHGGGSDHAVSYLFGSGRTLQVQSIQV